MTELQDRVAVPAGSLSLGGGAIYPEEQRRGQIDLPEFWLGPTEVTNQDFARFVNTTGYLTDAEQAPDRLLHPDLDPADAVPGSAVFTKIGSDQGMVWTFIPGASWRAPKGPDQNANDTGQTQASATTLNPPPSHDRSRPHSANGAP